MEESKKNGIMIAGIVACFVLAGVITYINRSNSFNAKAFADERIWVKCNNPVCKAEYQMDIDNYLVSLQEHADPMSEITTPPPLVCEKCGQESVSRAVKCKKCELIFFYGTSTDFPDRCPECGYSSVEEREKTAPQE